LIPRLPPEIVRLLTKREIEVQPPVPFDLTTLQTEAYKIFKIIPKETSQLAQFLYTLGLISYPRTSSQKLPKTIGYKKILKKLSKQKDISNICNELLNKKELKPVEGKKKDPAHPAIYPTGDMAKLAGRNLKLYSLVVRRFLAVFGECAKKENTSVIVDVNSEKFTFHGSIILKKGWYTYYKYLATKEVILPEINMGDELKKPKIKDEEKETQPPQRYTQASIIKEMERLSLGTKATRALILDALYQRKYVDGLQVEATPLGITLIHTLEKYSPEIIDEDLTKSFEEDMQKIREGKKKGKTVIASAKKILTKLLKKFKENEKKIGKALLKATEGENIFGSCPKCKKGTLILRRGRFGMFVACDRYEEGCETTAKLPKGALTKSTEKKCEKCKFPIVQIIKSGRRPQELCLSKDCPTKQPTEKPKSKKCPKCKTGEFVLRKGIYGSFYACGNFPKCRNIFSPKKKNFKKK
jgi:DNA topoisomerase-1